MSQSFWNFSLAVYSASTVQDECLHLQDQFGLDVNLVLFCAFFGAVHCIALTSDDISTARQEVQEWHEEIVRPLRAARRSLKTIDLGPDAQTGNAAMNLRTQVKAAELEAERVEQMILEQWAKARLADRPRGNSRDAALANLQVLITVYGIGPDRLVSADAMMHLIAAALDCASQSGNRKANE
jgi:uncharacterized protein (TIGR02444 family)